MKGGIFVVLHAFFIVLEGFIVCTFDSLPLRIFSYFVGILNAWAFWQYITLLNQWNKE